MSRTRSRIVTILPASGGILCLAILMVAARSPMEPQTTSKAIGEDPAKKLLLLRMKQPGSPLTISKLVVDDSEDPLMPLIHCTIKNISNKAIIAYALKHEAVFSERTGTVSGSVTFNNPDQQNGMPPGDMREAEIYGVKYGEMPQSVRLSIDLVEFTDGARWGPDTLKNGDRIDGARAGARAESDALFTALQREVRGPS